MNLIKILLLSVLTLSAFAGEERLICQEYDRETEQLLNRTVILTQTGESSDKLNEDGEYEAIQMPYRLDIYEGINVFPSHSVKGIVLTEDVWFEFTSNDETISFSTYWDELEESGLSIISNSGEEFADFVCRF